MAKFFLFISSILSSIALAFSLFFSGGGDVSREEIAIPPPAPDVRVQPTQENVPLEPSRASEENGTSAPAKKSTPIVPLDTKERDAAQPKKIEPQVSTLAAPLVRYSTANTSSGTLAGSEIVAWTNIYRGDNGFTPLKRNPQLDAAAIIKVHDMFNLQYFEHVSPKGKDAAALVSGVGYEYLWVGENLALGIFSDEKDLVDAWMASPGHRANILNAHFEEIGIGVEEGVYEGKPVWIAVQEFGKPAASCPAPESSLDARIEKNRAKIDELSAQAEGLIAEINRLANEHDAAAYNKKVSEYNALIAILNPIIEETKTLITEYNKEISEFNACIVG